MAMPRLFTFIGGKIKAVVLAIQTSAGAADADKLIATDATGRLHTSFLPAGVGPATASAVCSESLADGAFVDVYYDGVTAKVRNADGATLKAADGFVLSAFTSGQTALVYPLGDINAHLVGLSPGKDYWLSVTTPGGVQNTAPDNTGQLYQRLGVAISNTEIVTSSDLAVEIG